MKFKSILIALIASTTLLTMTGCGKQASDSSQSSSSISKSTSTSSKSSSTSSSSNSMSSNKTSSSEESSSSSDNDVTQISNQTAGVLAWKMANSSYFNEQIQNGMYYGTNSNSNYAKGYDFITAGGDVSSILYYKVNGNQITYKTWDQTGQATMDGHYKTVTMSLQSLVDQFYTNADQKNKIQADVKGLEPYSNHAS